MDGGRRRPVLASGAPSIPMAYQKETSGNTEVEEDTPDIHRWLCALPDADSPRIVTVFPAEKSTVTSLRVEGREDLTPYFVVPSRVAATRGVYLDSVKELQDSILRYQRPNGSVALLPNTAPLSLALIADSKSPLYMADDGTFRNDKHGERAIRNGEYQPPELPDVYLCGGGTVLRNVESALGDAPKAILLEYDGGHRNSVLKTENHRAVGDAKKMDARRPCPSPRAVPVRLGEVLEEAGDVPGCGVRQLQLENFSSGHATLAVVPRDEIVEAEATLKTNHRLGGEERAPHLQALADVFSGKFANYGMQLNEATQAVIPLHVMAKIMTALRAHARFVTKATAHRGNDYSIVSLSRRWILAAKATCRRTETLSGVAKVSIRWSDVGMYKKSPDSGKSPGVAKLAADDVDSSGLRAGLETLLDGILDADDTDGSVQTSLGMADMFVRRLDTAHVCSICQNGLLLMEGAVFMTSGLEAWSKTPTEICETSGKQAEFESTSMSRALMKQTAFVPENGLSVFVRFNRCVRALYAVHLGEHFSYVLQPGTRSSTYKLKFRRLQLAYHRRGFSAVAMIGATRVLGCAAFAPNSAFWEERHLSADLLWAVDFRIQYHDLKSTRNPITTPVKLAMFHKANILGAIRALALFDLAACVGLLNPALLVQGFCRSCDSAVEDAAALSPSEFLNAHVAVFHEGAEVDEGGENGQGTASRSLQEPLLLKLDDMSDAVGKLAANIFIRQGDKGVVALQAALPEFSELANDILEGEHDSEFLRNFSDSCDELKERCHQLREDADIVYQTGLRTNVLESMSGLCLSHGNCQQLRAALQARSSNRNSVSDRFSGTVFGRTLDIATRAWRRVSPKTSESEASDWAIHGILGWALAKWETKSALACSAFIGTSDISASLNCRGENWASTARVFLDGIEELGPQSTTSPGEAERRNNRRQDNAEGAATAAAAAAAVSAAAAAKTRTKKAATKKPVAKKKKSLAAKKAAAAAAAAAKKRKTEAAAMKNKAAGATAAEAVKRRKVAEAAAAEKKEAKRTAAEDQAVAVAAAVALERRKVAEAAAAERKAAEKKAAEDQAAAERKAAQMKAADEQAAAVAAAAAVETRKVAEAAAAGAAEAVERRKVAEVSAAEAAAAEKKEAEKKAEDKAAAERTTVAEDNAAAAAAEAVAAAEGRKMAVKKKQGRKAEEAAESRMTKEAEERRMEAEEADCRRKKAEEAGESRKEANTVAFMAAAQRSMARDVAELKECDRDWRTKANEKMTGFAQRADPDVNRRASLVAAFSARASERAAAKAKSSAKGSNPEERDRGLERPAPPPIQKRKLGGGGESPECGLPIALDTHVLLSRILAHFARELARTHAAPAGVFGVEDAIALLRESERVLFLALGPSILRVTGAHGQSGTCVEYAFEGGESGARPMQHTPKRRKLGYPSQD